jgi:hypothetical protein
MSERDRSPPMTLDSFHATPPSTRVHALGAGRQVPYPILAAMTAAGLIVKSTDGYCLAGR